MGGRRQRRGEDRTARGGRSRRRRQDEEGAVPTSPDCPARQRVGAERQAHLAIEEQRILAQLLWEESLGQARHEHDLERATARLVRAADEHAAVTVCRGLLVERAQTLGQHVPRFFERDRSDRAHRAKLAEHTQHPRGPAQHARRQLAEPLEPLAPRGLHGPGRQRLDDREREVRQMCEVVAIPLEARQLRRLRILSQAFFLDLGVVSLAQPAQPPAPALGIAPTTDASTISRSHFHGARRPPSTMGDARRLRPLRGLAVSWSVGRGVDARKSGDEIVGRRKDLEGLRPHRRPAPAPARGTRQSGWPTAARPHSSGSPGTRGRTDAGAGRRDRTRR